MLPVSNERDVVLACLQGTAAASEVGEHRKAMWDRCWSEHEGLTPAYMASDVVRCKGRFWHAPGAEKRFLDNLRGELYERYLDGVGEVSEFGCGLGQNLVPLLNTGRRVRGFDWSAAACEKVRALGIEAQEFDMFSPADVSISGAAVTIHAMEQLGRRWGRFLDFLLAAGPSIVIHIEPVAELYDAGNLLDYLALQYHQKRNYLFGYFSRLKELEGAGTIEILEARRSHFGNLYHEAYSVMVWRPS